MSGPTLVCSMVRSRMARGVMSRKWAHWHGLESRPLFPLRRAPVGVLGCLMSRAVHVPSPGRVLRLRCEGGKGGQKGGQKGSGFPPSILR